LQFKLKMQVLLHLGHDLWLPAHESGLRPTGSASRRDDLTVGSDQFTLDSLELCHDSLVFGTARSAAKGGDRAWWKKCAHSQLLEQGFVA
jgi:hypothetical protein